jgi:hypothetical protein
MNIENKIINNDDGSTLRDSAIKHALKTLSDIHALEENTGKTETLAVALADGALFIELDQLPKPEKLESET